VLGEGIGSVVAVVEVGRRGAMISLTLRVVQGVGPMLELLLVVSRAITELIFIWTLLTLDVLGTVGGVLFVAAIAAGLG